MSDELTDAERDEVVELFDDWQPSRGLAEHYERCVDPDCPDAYAYRAPFPDGEHWHPRSHGPELPACLICGTPGRILCELHR